jgi:hypothetical protein
VVIPLVLLPCIAMYRTNQIRSQVKLALMAVLSSAMAVVATVGISVFYELGISEFTAGGVGRTSGWVLTWSLCGSAYVHNPGYRTG